MIITILCVSEQNSTQIEEQGKGSTQSPTRDKISLEPGATVPKALVCDPGSDTYFSPACWHIIQETNQKGCPDLYTFTPLCLLYIFFARSPGNFPTTTHCAPAAGPAGDPWTAAKLVPRLRSQTSSPASSCERHPPPPQQTHTARRHTSREKGEHDAPNTKKTQKSMC